MTSRSCCSASCTFRVFDSIFLLVVVALQGTALNLLMVEYDKNNKNLYFWFAGDALVLLIFLVSVIVSNKVVLDKIHAKLDHIDIPHITVPMYGSLPFGYISWFLYGSLMVCKIVYIFQSNIPNVLNIQFYDDFFSTSSLKVALSLSVLIFILLVNTENDAEPNSDRNSYIGDLCKGIAFDLFDTIVLLSLLLINESKLDTNELFTVPLKNAIIGLACANFLIPGFSLMKLSLSDFGELSQPIKLSLFTKTLKLFGINIPYMIIRIYLYNTHSEMPLFLVKNVIAVIVSLRYMIPEYITAVRCQNTHSSSAVKPINIIT